MNDFLAKTVSAFALGRSGAWSPAVAFAAPAPTDQAFTAKVSQGGMFEIEAGKLAEKSKAEAQDVKDFAAMEVHDHALVGQGLKTAAGHEGIKVSDQAQSRSSRASWTS